jgi:tetratricopeptide (TPR) repeat protein
MPQDLTLDYLIVSRYDEPPAVPTLTRALASASLGDFAWMPAQPRTDDLPPPGGRIRLGAYTAPVPRVQRGTARLIVARHEGAVTAGMPEAAFAELTRGLAPADIHTLRECGLALDLRVTAPTEQAALALAWAVRVVKVLLDLTEGAGIDLAAQRGLGRADVARLQTADPLVHVAFHNQAWDPESRWLHTHGLQKFGQPELELVAVPLSLQTEGLAFLRDVALSLATGDRLSVGDEIDMAELGGAVAVISAADANHLAPCGRLLLADLPPPGAAQDRRINVLLAKLALASANQRAENGDLTGATEDVERVLTADPEDRAALLVKAQLLLRAGDLTGALVLGELMEVRAPGDYRGPLVMGQALATLGRHREALHALNRAIEREPEAIAAYLARAEVYERLGELRLGADDRAHATYLMRAEG